MTRAAARSAKSTLDGNTAVAPGHLADAAAWHAARIGGPSPHAMPAPAAGEVLVNTASDANGFNARITAFADGRYVVSWTEGSEATGNFFSTFFRIYAADGTPTSAAIEYGNTASSDNDYGSFAVLANGNIAAVWVQTIQAIVTRVYNASGAVVAAEQVVSTPSTSFPDPSVVALATGYVVAYSSGNDIVYSMRSNTGTVIGTNRYVTDVATATPEDHVDLAGLPGGGFVAVWVQETFTGSPAGVPDSSQVMMRLFSSTGAALGVAAAVNAGTTGFSHPSVATLTGGGFVIAWQNEGAAGGTDIVARRYDASGAPVATEFVVNAAAGFQLQASTVALANGGFLIAWEGDDGDGRGVFAQAYDAGGVADGGAFRVNETIAGNQRIDGVGAEAMVQLADGTLVFTWSGNGEGDDAGIFTRRFSPDDLGNIAPDASDDIISTLPGQPVTIAVLGNDFERNNAATVTAVGTASAGSVVINPNGTLTYTPGASFNGSDSFTYTITGPSGTDTATVTILDGRTPQALGNDILANQSPSQLQDGASITALADGGFVASWTVTQSSSFHAMARVFATDGTPMGAEFQVSSGANIDITAVTALANGGFAMLYIETASSPDVLYAQTYTAAGTPVGAAVAVASDPAFDGIHLTGRAEGGFAVIWSTGTDILGRFHDDSGAALGSAFTISASPRTDRLPAIEQLDDGSYIAVWQRTDVNGNPDIFAVRLDASGAVVGAEFRPHGSATGDQATPVAAALEDGGFVILWQIGGDVFARRYDAASVAVGAEFRVNQTIAGDQKWPAVTALEGGGFVVSWVSVGQDGNGNGVFAQAFDAAGLRYGAEFQVNALAAGSQTLAVATINSIAQLADGTLVFSWEGAGAGDSGGVFVRRFSIGDPHGNPNEGTSGADSYDGTGGDDTYNGLGGDDTINGLGGNDTLYGGEGDDGLLGGEGNDLLFGELGDDSLHGGAGDDGLVGAAGTDFLSGGDNNDSLHGQDGVDTLLGGAGNDFLSGGAGADMMYGGTGDDIYIYDEGDFIVETAGEGNDLIYATASYTLAAGSEIEILSAGDMAGIADTSLGGNELRNILWGNAGLNTLSGFGGNDSLHGFGGNDGLLGGDGNDYLDGGDGDDSLHGEAGLDTLAGGAGNDFLSGGDGVDVMYGGSGNDTYIADSGDYIVEAAGGGTDIVYATGDFALSAGMEIEGLYGNELANELRGNELANILDGKGGNDVLTGGAGADMFAFTTAPGAGNVDNVTDFVSGIDRIGLDDAVFTSIGGLGALNANAFATGAAAGDGDDRIIYDGATGALLYDADGTGTSAQAVQFATLAPGLALTASDFQVI